MKNFGMVVMVGAVSFATAASAGAAPLTLVDVPAGSEIQQTDNTPCIFGDASCKDGALPHHVTFPAGGTSTNYYETVSYTIEQINAAVGSTFDVGIDVNTTAAASEILDYFRVYLGTTLTTANLLYSYEGNQNIALAVDLKNGTGWSDWLLRTIDLSGVLAGSIITFEVAVLNAVDGVEQFFLISAAGGTTPGGTTPGPVVPEPASMLLFATGLSAVAYGARRRKQQAKRRGSPQA